jgi:CRISPR-associated protein Cmr2
MNRHFHFTIGPVQGFVAQARRTRDFWAGSFILSWLAAVAMKAVKVQGDKIVFPLPDDNYLGWLEGQGQDPLPRQGSIPNRFTASVGENFQAEQIVESVRTAWRALTEIVWEEDLEKYCKLDSVTREIWDRQIDHFWDISWVFGAEINLLDRRKNWRSHPAAAEAGVKCMVMEGWQELSGVAGPNATLLTQFWNPIRMTCQSDLVEGEHLCAIAFIKRRFARHFHKLHNVNMPGGWHLSGWKLSPGVPSVMYMAAVHWLEGIIQQEETDKLIRLHEVARQLLPDYGEWDTDIACISKVYQQQGKMLKRLASLDGSVFFEHILDNRKLYSEAQAKIMREALSALATQEHPTPFYAILLMDGDSLGSHLGFPEKQPLISKALERFTQGVGNIVYQHNGFLIYAGGDDVLAMLPLEDALDCAVALRKIYLEAFTNTGIPSTLSGAIEFAHVKMPLTRILKDAHDLLDNVAKDRSGRDAIAVRVWKPGGKALEWAMPWTKAMPNGKLILTGLAAAFRKEQEQQPTFSSKFFYKIEERFEVLNPGPKEKDSLLSEEEACKLLAVDYLASGVNERRQPKLKVVDAEKIIQPLLKQCRPVIREMHEEKIKFMTSKQLNVDGALLVRFLVQKGVESR